VIFGFSNQRALFNKDRTEKKILLELLKPKPSMSAVPSSFNPTEMFNTALSAAKSAFGTLVESKGMSLIDPANVGLKWAAISIAIIAVVMIPLSYMFVGEDPLGEDPLGEDPLSEEYASAEYMGEDPLGEDPLGEDPLGEDPLGEDNLGEENPIISALGEMADTLGGFLGGKKAAKGGSKKGGKKGGKNGKSGGTSFFMRLILCIVGAIFLQYAVVTLPKLPKAAAAGGYQRFRVPYTSSYRPSGYTGYTGYQAR
jgi:hypothetical protein